VEGPIGGSELETYADVILRLGANVQPGQTVLITGLVEHAYLLRILADRAYVQGAGAAYVYYRDTHVIRSQLTLATADGAAARIDPWMKAATDAAIAERWATVDTTGDSTDNEFEGASPGRSSAWQANWCDQSFRTIDAGLSWTIAACPVPGWAQRVYGAPDLAPLWNDLRYVMRLDEPDPVAAWQARMDELGAQAARLDEAAFTAVRFRGEGTDLSVTLHPDSVWQSARYVTPWGISYVPNLPTEEIFTTPDYRGVEGTVATTKPVLINGVRAEGLVLRFEAGRIVEVKARTGADAVRAQIAVDDGASRLGEVSLVDASSRIGRLDRIFKDTLLDENAACHIAWGLSCYESLGEHLPATNEERNARGVNMSRIHQDVMIGGPDVTVFGVTKEGAEVPVLLRERWQI